MPRGWVLVVEFYSGDEFDLDGTDWQAERARAWARDSVQVLAADGTDRGWTPDDGSDALDSDDRADMASALEGCYYYWSMAGFLDMTEPTGPFSSEGAASRAALKQAQEGRE